MQKQSLNVIQDITGRHEHDNVKRNIPMYNGKNLEQAAWLLQIEKVALLTNSQEYELGTAKSTNTPYKKLKRIGQNINCQESKRKLEKVCPPIATEVHTANDLTRNQWPDQI